MCQYAINVEIGFCKLEHNIKASKKVVQETKLVQKIKTNLAIVTWFLSNVSK